MGETNKFEENNSVPDLGSILSGIIRQVIKEEIREAKSGGLFEDADVLLTVPEVAKILKMSPDWIYENAKTLPFRVKLHTKALRFSSRGLQTYMATKRGRC